MGEVLVDATPISPFDPSLIFASPHDAARFYLKVGVALFSEKHDLNSAVRSLLQAILIDHDNLLALFDLGLLCEARGTWEDAQTFLEDVEKRATGELKILSTRELERVRVIAPLQQTEEGRRRLRYDAALIAAVDKQKTLTIQEAIDAYAIAIQIDKGRWEAPAMVGGILTDQERFADAVPYLNLAVKSSDPGARAGLSRAAAEARKEADFLDAVKTAKSAWESADYKKAAQFYERSWQLFQERSENAFAAVTSLLILDDVNDAVQLLKRIRDSGQQPAAGRASIMMKELGRVDPLAKTESERPVSLTTASNPTGKVISSFIPDPITASMRIEIRPPGNILTEKTPVLLAQSLAEDKELAAKASLQGDSMPILPYPQVTGEHPLAEFRQFSTRIVVPPPVAVVELVKTPPKTSWKILSSPPRAQVRIDSDETEACRSPCELVLAPGKHKAFLTLSGFEASEVEIALTRLPKMSELSLVPRRGKVLIESGIPGAEIFVNGKSIGAVTPSRLSLAVGTYVFSVRSGATQVERELMVRDDFPIRLLLP